MRRKSLMDRWDEWVDRWLCRLDEWDNEQWLRWQRFKDWWAKGDDDV